MLDLSSFLQKYYNMPCSPWNGPEFSDQCLDTIKVLK